MAKSGQLTAVIMAKLPRPGQVMTRLAAPGGVTAEIAAEIAWSSLRCVLVRLQRHWPVVVAVTPDGAAESMAPGLGHAASGWLDQGAGDLGRRIDHVWRQVGAGVPVAFFGMDSPDVPEGHLDALEAELGRHDAVVGPTFDGGYWTLATDRYRPALIDSIDWGSDSVYDQTCQRAREAGVRLGVLPAWHDIDHPQDVIDLRHRLAHPGGSPEPLRELAQALDASCGPLPPPTP